MRVCVCACVYIHSYMMRAVYNKPLNNIIL